jgi:hypothetical protein
LLPVQGIASYAFNYSAKTPALSPFEALFSECPARRRPVSPARRSLAFYTRIAMQSSSLLCVAAISAVWPVLSQDPWTFTTPALDQKIAACCYQNYSTSETIERRLQSTSGSGASPDHITIYRSAASPFVNHVPPGTPLPAPPQLLTEVMNSALVVAGVPVAERSLPTRDHTFLFTEYRVRVDHVYYAGSTNVSAGQDIIVSAPGGNLRSVDFTSRQSSLILMEFLSTNARYSVCGRFRHRMSILLYRPGLTTSETGELCPPPEWRQR